MKKPKRSVAQLVRDRLNKTGLYDTPEYWDTKATAYEGLARSAWPSNTYNTLLHAEQRDVLLRLAGNIAGKRVADVGCGTGRMAQEFARRGAHVTGFDFSPQSIAVAQAEAAEQGLHCDFGVANIFEEPKPEDVATFDVVLSLGCLTIACSSRERFDDALRHVVALARPGGRVVFLEPVHQGRLLGRILRMSVSEWIRAAEGLGLALQSRGGVHFVPARYALAFVEAPMSLTRPVFDLGEWLLARSPRLEFLADYKYLAFDVPVLEP